MAITEKTVFDSITILEDGQIQLRKARVILDTDGTELTKVFHRVVLEPGQSVVDLPPRIQEVCNIIWKAKVISDYNIAKALRDVK